MRREVYRDFVAGVKEAAFQHAIECGDSLASAAVLDLQPYERARHINTWWDSAVQREPFLKTLLKPDEQFDQPPTPTPIKLPKETHRRAQIRKLMVIWQKTYWLFKQENRDLSMNGGCWKHGIAALYRFRGAFRHYRKKARIKGLACQPFDHSEYKRHDALPNFAPYGTYTGRMKIDHDRVRSAERGLASFNECMARDGHPPYNFGSRWCTWDRELLNFAIEHRQAPLASRLASFKYQKKVELNRRANRKPDLYQFSTEELREVLIMRGAAA